MRLEWRNLSKRFGGRAVLTGLSGVLADGEVLVVTGANGSGKTTLLRMLAGLTRPSAGEVRFTDDTGSRPIGQCREELGFVTPDLALYGELTALENLDFFASARGLRYPRAQLDARLEEVGLSGRGDDEVRAFSSGMKQRLKLAFAVLAQPRLLLLDEPGSNLDEAGAEMVRRLIHHQRTRGLCVLATNDHRERSYGDRVLAVDAGA